MDPIITDESTEDTAPASLTQEEAVERYLSDRDTNSASGAADDSAPEADTSSEETAEAGSDEEASSEDQEEAPEADADADASGEEGADDEEVVANDLAKVKFTVDGVEYTTTVAELKRLAGQEAALTRKSQEVAETRKKFETVIASQAAMIAGVKQRIEKAAEAYKGIDLAEAARTMEPEDFQRLRSEMQRIYEDWQFVSQEEKAFFEKADEARRDMLRKQALDALPVLKERIPEWSNDHYKTLLSYAVDSGMPKDVVVNIVDPAAIEMIHKAWRFDQATKTVQTKVKKAAKAATNTVRKAARDDGDPAHVQTLRKRLAATGSIDDAVEFYTASRS